MKKLIIVAVVLLGIAGFSSQAKAWSCGETHYSCSGGVSGDKSESASRWTWTCSDSIGKASCSEDKPPVEKIIIKEVPVEKIVIKEVIKEVIVEKEVPVEKLVTVEKVVEVPVEKIVKKIVYRDKRDNDKNHKKVSREKKTLPKTGLPLGGLAAITLSTAGAYGAFRKFRK